MWCPSNLAYTIKVYVVCCDVRLIAYKIEVCIRDVMTFWPSLHN